MNCPNKKNKGKDGDDKKKKKFYHKKRDGKAYLVEWDSDASSDEDDDDSSSKLNAGIAIKEAPSLFSSPHCLMDILMMILLECWVRPMTTCTKKKKNLRP
jgi:hypothetical protein